jgi:hypothetical protein
MIKPVSSATGMNWIGGDGAACGMVPAHQSLDAENFAVGEPHDRLVVQLELVHGQRVLQV